MRPEAVRAQGPLKEVKEDSSHPKLSTDFQSHTFVWTKKYAVLTVAQAHGDIIRCCLVGLGSGEEEMRKFWSSGLFGVADCEGSVQRFADCRLIVR